MKRKILCAVLALALLLAAGCGGPASTGSASSSADVSGSAASSGETVGGIPEYEYLNHSLGLQDNGFYEGVTALDHVTLPEKLTGITIPADVQAVDEEAVTAEVKAILEGYADYEKILDRAVENGDKVNIDYVGRINGVEFEGGNTQGEGTTVTAGGSNYIDDFLTQIIGAKPGDTVMVEVTFPTPYPNNTELSGKDAVFETVINYIQGAYIIPEMTDADVEKYLKEDYGYTTLEEAKEASRALIKYDQMRAHVLEWLQENCTFGEIPASIHDAQNEIIRINMNNTAYHYGVDLKTLLGSYGWSTMQDVYDHYQSGYVENARLFLMCQAVMERLGLEVTEADVEDFFVKIIGNSDYETYIFYYGSGYVYQDVMAHKVAMYLMDNAVME